MAESSSQEKTEDPTPKRLRDARKKGDVPKSKDFTMIIVVIVVFVTIAFSASYISGQIKTLMVQAFTIFSDGPLDGDDLFRIGRLCLLTLAKTLMPIFLAGMISAVIASLLQVGAIFSTEVLKPKFEKLNPIEGVKNMFKAVTFIELLKNIAKLSLVIFLAYHTISDYMDSILLSSRIHIVEIVTLMGEILSSFFIKVAVVFLIIALFDMGVQRWNYTKKHRMSKDEVKREYKQDEGDPMIKSQRKRIHREMVFGDVKQNVKKSDVVVSNPTHVAVALQYDREEMAAPEVMVKGQNQFAEMILKIAREEGIPVMRNIPLAWSLLQLEEGAAIPEDLYEPVAEVLSLVYELKQEGEVAPEPEVSEKPSEFRPL